MAATNNVNVPVLSSMTNRQIKPGQGFHRLRNWKLKPTGRRNHVVGFSVDHYANFKSSFLGLEANCSCVVA